MEFLEVFPPPCYQIARNKGGNISIPGFPYILLPGIEIFPPCFGGIFAPGQRFGSDPIPIARPKMGGVFSVRSAREMFWGIVSGLCEMLVIFRFLQSISLVLAKESTLLCSLVMGRGVGKRHVAASRMLADPASILGASGSIPK